MSGFALHPEASDHHDGLVDFITAHVDPAQRVVDEMHFYRRKVSMTAASAAGCCFRLG